MIVRNCGTGEILKGELAPKAEELEAWLETHPGFEVISRDALSDSDDEKSDHEEEKEKKVEEEEAQDDEFEGMLLFYDR